MQCPLLSAQWCGCGSNLGDETLDTFAACFVMLGRGSDLDAVRTARRSRTSPACDLLLLLAARGQMETTADEEKMLQRTPVLDNTARPIWNHRMEWPIQDAGASRLVVAVKHHSNIGLGRTLGSVQVEVGLMGTDTIRRLALPLAGQQARGEGHALRRRVFRSCTSAAWSQWCWKSNTSPSWPVPPRRPLGSSGR